MKKHGVKFHERIPDSESLPKWFPEGGLLVLDELTKETANSCWICSPNILIIRTSPSCINHLGDMTDELEGDDYYVDFTSAGPKNYKGTKPRMVKCAVKFEDSLWKPISISLRMQMMSSWPIARRTSDILDYRTL